MENSFDLGTLLRNHKREYKNKPMEFGNVANGVQKRLQKNLIDRKSCRSSVFDKLRNIPKCESPVKLSQVEQKMVNRRLQLEKWKAEKNKRKREEALQKKKPFVTGVVRIPLKFELPPPVKPKPSTSGCITRSQTVKNMKLKNKTDTKCNDYNFAPKNASFKPPRIIIKTAKTSPALKPNKKDNTMTNKSKKVNVKSLKQNKANTKEIHTTVAFEHKERLYELQTENETLRQSTAKFENVLSPEKSEETNEIKNKISPCVTVSRGKEKARQEMKKKMDDGLLDDDASNIDNVSHFRCQLDSEIERITEMCQKWEKINEQTQLPDLAQEAILSAVGQARLLMTQKLAQFRLLVERCARPDPASALVTPADLHGFWDMVFMQVENVDVRFMNLDKLREQGWVEEKPVALTRKPAIKPIAKKPNKQATGPSRLKDMIAAARKAKKEQQETEAFALAPVDDENKTFEAGFFSIRSPVKSPSLMQSPARDAATPSQKASLLKSVLSSEANRASASKRSASFAMLRASLLGRNVECDGVAPLPQTPLAPINLKATPSRSILKSAKDNKRSSGRPSKIVFFEKFNEDVQDVAEEQNTTELPEENKAGDSDSVNRKVADISGSVSMMNLDEVSEKENTGRKSRLSRQQDIECSNVMVTRSMGENVSVTDDGDGSVVRADRSLRRSSRRALHELGHNAGTAAPQTPKRSSRRRKGEVHD